MTGGLRRRLEIIFAASASVATSDHALFLGSGQRPEVEERNARGDHLRLIRWPDVDRTVKAGDVERYRERQVADAQNENERRDRSTYLEQMPYAAKFPAYHAIHVARDGRVWAPLYEPLGPANPRRWLVLDTTGRALGEVVMPEGLRVVEIGDDYVLGVVRDELDVEHVRLHRLVTENRS